ncbi:peptide chain release factor N(5)-glutamine methyltransferase [Rothia sp. AR01]|uniref:peptide chain release factor N(5)-glutamine methyltransferase n=1 Tax=Rothia santali TaxID=2949643 RepID=A0A9X2KIF1_9MICC|nr:peptide chain release factor N(5)-glutamine methyltransferase [Rothia santali]
MARAGIATPRADAELLAAHLISRETGEPVSRGELAARMVTGSWPAPAGYAELVASRAERIPLQHLTGEAHFRNLTLRVGPGVFVPRPETEVLVDELNAFLAARGEASPVVVDLATGSGALALAAAQENPGARVLGVELSEAALAWARANAEDRAAAGDRPVEIVAGDAATALPELEGAVAAVLTNPPYIPEDMVPRDPEVALHDPETALYGGSPDGMLIPTAFVRRAARLLVPGGLLIMEHAEVQAAAAAGLFAAEGFTGVETVLDLTGRERATKGYAGGRGPAAPGAP